VVACLPQVLVECPNLVYVIIGRGEEAENLKLQIKNLKLEDKVLLLTEVEAEELKLWYQTSDIFIMTSRELNGDYEGFGIVYLEAGLAKKPVIAGKSGGVSDAVVDGVTGLMVDSENLEEINKAIIKLVQFPGLRDRLGQAGHNRAIKEFNWEGQGRKVWEIVNK